MMLFVIFLGGGAGAVSRYLLSLGIGSLWDGSFPLGTFLINLIGCFLIGILGGLTEKVPLDPHLRAALQTGFLGGFTTFSSFGLETFQLFRRGQAAEAAANLIGSNVLGVLLVFAGFFVSKFLFSRKVL